MLLRGELLSKESKYQTYYKVQKFHPLTHTPNWCILDITQYFSLYRYFISLVKTVGAVQEISVSYTCWEVPGKVKNILSGLEWPLPHLIPGWQPLHLPIYPYPQGKNVSLPDPLCHRSRFGCEVSSQPQAGVQGTAHNPLWMPARCRLSPPSLSGVTILSLCPFELMPAFIVCKHNNSKRGHSIL